MTERYSEERAKWPNWLIVIGKGFARVLVFVALPLLAALSYWYFADLSPGGLKIPESEKELPARLITLVHTFITRVASLINYIVALIIFICALVVVYIYHSYRMKNLVLSELNLLWATLKDIKEEGLRLVPYRSTERGKRYFFHVDIQKTDLDYDNTEPSMTVDVIFAGPEFYAKDYLFSPDYLRYFFWRRQGISEAGNARRIFLFGSRKTGAEVADYDHDLVVLLNMSALAGYKTYVIPPVVYDRVVDKIASFDLSTPKAKIREIFHGHPAWTLTRSSTGSPHIAAKYLPAKPVVGEYGKLMTEDIREPLKSTMLRVVVGDLCQGLSEVDIKRDAHSDQSWLDADYLFHRLQTVSDHLKVDPTSLSTLAE